ncbi:unnamed protein product, partial [Musa acuminata subsp. burmannicoides]
LGLESTALPVLVISIAIITAFWLGHTSGLVDETGNPTGGLFGIAVGTMGMLSTDAYVLTMDMFGPVADNAGGGIMEMSQQPESVWEITDVLDVVRNTTKAITKGFAIGSVALATFLLSSAIISLLNSAFACSAVGRTAQEVNNEVRRQFIERPGIMVSSPTSYVSQTTFAIVASASLQEMIKPGAWATISPVVIGLFFRLLGHYTGQQLLGAKVVALMLMFATVVGILLALFLNTSGSAWDNSKKYIEAGRAKLKTENQDKKAEIINKENMKSLNFIPRILSIFGHLVILSISYTYRVGDPFKDTYGPSIHVPIKMLATITLVMAPHLI